MKFYYECFVLKNKNKYFELMRQVHNETFKKGSCAV